MTADHSKYARTCLENVYTQIKRLSFKVKGGRRMEEWRLQYNDLQQEEP